MVLSYVVFKRKYLIDNKFCFVFALFIISLIQGSYSPNILGNYSNYFSLIFGLFWLLTAYLILKDNKKMISRINGTILISSIFPLALGLYQWIYYKQTGRIPELPFSFLVASEEKTGLTYNTYSRITSCFGDPAYMSTFYVVVFSIGLQYFIGNKKALLVKRLISLSIALLAAIEIIMAISLSGIIGIAAAVAFIIILNFANFKKGVIAIFFVSLSFLFFFLAIKTLNPELINVVVYKFKSSSQTTENMFGRIHYIQNGLNAFFRHPLFGAGFGGLSLNGSFSSAHNSLLTVLGQQGIVVFIMNIILLIGIPIKGSIVLKKNNQFGYIPRGFIVSLFSVLVLTLGYDTLYSLDSCYVLVLLGLVIPFYKESDQFHFLKSI